MSRVVVVGGGIGGLAAAALIGRAGHEVTLLEANPWVGGKSRRIELEGRRIDTGPSLLTFPGVWEEFLRRWDAADGQPGEAAEVAGLRLKRLPEVGRYYYRGETTSLPVEEGHPWRAAWERFVGIHGGLGPEVTRLLTADPANRRTLPALGRLLRIYGAKLTTRSYLDGLQWLPEGLREIIAIHTLNAGVAPTRTPALYASMPAIMAVDGVFVPEGGVYEIVLALQRLARGAGVEVKTGEAVREIGHGRVVTAEGEYRAERVVSALDAGRLESLLDPERERAKERLSCSGVAVYATLREELPAGVGVHSIVLPSDPFALYTSLETGKEPRETMAFLNYYRGGEIYPNSGGTLAVLLTAPANGREYGLEDPFVRREIERVSAAAGLQESATTYFGEYEILDPGYFGAWGSAGGALYGAVRPFWRSGPLHRPLYNDRRRPWLWRVGASVHPGGGIPAVLGGAMISTCRMLRSLVKWERLRMGGRAG
ncbi:MAG TPA: NAD(P)/FAD-dependent oxidoreductase [Rubrobacter sp.]|nr:NAD(P)/FAD-dependent oxidoreductase [Rubrobacter sp.]